MSQLSFSEAELLLSHDYDAEHEAAGRRLHGGFDASGRYLRPRALVRGPAVEAWTEALRARGGDLIEADASLLRGIRYPNEAQHQFLLERGLDQSFWNMLTITGIIEARGRLLAALPIPDMQGAVWEDVSEMAIGHLHKGLLKAHGLDEGGEPERGIGGHDVMWFALRDLALGVRDAPTPDVPERIGRPDATGGEFEELPAGYEQLVSLLLNVLLIEFRAEIGFGLTERLLRNPSLFVDRRAGAEAAAELVCRIRFDEEIHVQSLRLYLGELRVLTFRTKSGGRLPGRDVIDPFWERIVHWATVEQPKLVATQQRQIYRDRILAHDDGARLVTEFEALADAPG